MNPSNQIPAPATPAAPFEVYDVTNAQRLAGTRGDGTTPLEAGNHVRVTDQGDRIEQALNADDFSDEDNWLTIGPNTVELIIDKREGNISSGTTINGVDVSIAQPVSVGWVVMGDPIDLVHGGFADSIGDWQLWKVSGNQVASGPDETSQPRIYPVVSPKVKQVTVFFANYQNV